ncbi:hypothetical protein KAX02_07370 [candidate division WOR-3 bacterium]|nr:hypothetical protein [candidate division WOR-3 bacterium]
MIILIATLIAIGSFVVGCFLFILFWSEDSRLEKYYKLTAKDIGKAEAISKIGIPFKTDVIIDSGHKYSRLRTIIKKVLSRIRGHEILDTVLVFNMNTTEQKAFLIFEAIKGSLFYIELLDAKFIEDLAKYHAYRYASEAKSVDKDVKFLLRKDFEKTSNRDCITKLMDPKYSEKVVLNPPPEIKPLLEEIVLPIVIEWSKELENNNTTHAEKERFKSLFMVFTKGLCHRTWGILFIGTLNTDEYIALFGSGVHKFSKGILLAARGHHVTVLLKLWNRICDVSQARWSIKFHPTDVIYQEAYKRYSPVTCFRRFVLKETIT